MSAIRLWGDIGFATHWIVSLAAIVGGVLVWHRTQWKVGWAPIIALLGFQTVWYGALAALGVMTSHHPRPFPWRDVVSTLPFLIALVAAARLAWAPTAAMRD